MKYIVIDTEADREGYAIILTNLVVGILPHIDEDQCEQLIFDFLSEHKLSEEGALRLGDLLQHLCQPKRKNLLN